MSLILAIEPDAAQADAVRRAVRSLPGVDLILVESRDAALTILKGRVPDMLLLSALLPPGDDAALTASLRAAPGAGHVEMITIPLLEHGPGFQEKRGGIFGFGRRKASNEVRVKSSAFASELRAHLDRIAEIQETQRIAKRRQEQAAATTESILDSRESEQSRESDSEPASGSGEWTGPADASGDRQFGTDDEGRAIELLRLSRDFADSRNAISDRIVRLTAVDRAALAQALRLDNDPESGRLILVSERVAGVRLGALLARASERMIVPDLPAALFVMRRLLSTAASVHARTGVAHLAIAPERIVVTPRADVVIVEAALAAAIEARSFNIDAASTSRGLRQIGLIGLSVMLGRPVSGDADINTRSELLAEAVDVATIRVNEPFGAALRAWFDRALAGDSGSLGDFHEAADALASAFTSPDAGGVALRRTLKAFLAEVGGTGGADAEAIEAARIRVARARQISHRGAFVVRESDEPVAEPEQAPAFETPEPIEELPAEEFPPLIAAEPPVAPFEPVEEAPPQPQPDARRPTLLELFRSARSSDADADAPSPPLSIFKDPPPEPAEPPITASTTAFSAAVIPESPFEESTPAAAIEPAVEEFVAESEHLSEPAPEPQIETFEQPSIAEPRELSEPPAEPIVEQPEAPPVEAPPAEPPAVERKRPSILELFRASKPRQQTREPEPEPEAAPETPVEEVAAHAFESHEPKPEPEQPPSILAEPAHPSSMFADAISVDDVTVEPILERPVEAAPPIERVERVDVQPPPVEEPVEPARPEERAKPRRASLLEFLRSSPFGKSKREPQAATAPPPEPEPAPVTEPAPAADAAAEPLHDIFAELIHAARSVAPTPPPAPAKPRKKSEPPRLIEEPEPIVPEPVQPEPVEHASFGAAVEEEWATDPVEPVHDVTPIAEPTPPAQSEDHAEWSDWTLPESSQAEETAEKSEPAPPREKFRLPDEDEWPTWNELESAEPLLAPDPEPVREEPARHEEEPPDEWATREEQLPEPVEPPPPPPPQKKRKPSLLEAFRSSRGEEPAATPQPAPKVPPPIEPAADQSVDDVVAQFDAFASTAESVPAPDEFPAFRELTSPPTYTPPAYTPPPPSRPPAPPPQPTFVPPQPTFAPPPPAYVSPPQAPYVPPPPPPAPPIGFAPSIGIEPAPRLAPVARPADFAPQPAYAPPQAARGPVTRRAPVASRRGWVPMAGAAFVIACLAIAGRAYYFSAPADVAAPEEKASKPTTVNAKGTGSVAITSEPPGARVTIDGKPRGVTPLTVASLRPGAHKVVLDSSAGTVRREVKIVAGREVSLDESIYAGWVAVYAPFELQISEGSRLLGTTDNQIMLAPGRHQLELTNRQLGYHESRGIEVSPGETTTINIKAAEGIVRIIAPDGAEVWIDGERVGQTPLGDLRVPVGARDIVVRHPELGEQHTVANVTIGARAEVTIEFRRPKIPDN